jgi:gliding motility-associated-like protein
MTRLYGFVFLVISWLGQSVALGQCPAAVSIRISQVNNPSQPAYASFCQGEQVQLNLVGDQPGLTYQWKLNGQNPPNGTSSTFLAGSSGFYTITVYGGSGVNKCTITSLPVSIEANDCQPTGRARIRGIYLEDFNGDASLTGYQNPFLRLGFLTYKSDLTKFPQQVRVSVYQKSNDRLMTTLNLQRQSSLERNLLSLDAACGIESTQLYDVLYFLVSPSGSFLPFDFDPAIYNDPGGYYLVSEGVCCRETADDIAGPDNTVVGYMELSNRQRYNNNINNKGSMFGTVFNLVSKVEACTNKPLTIDYFDARDPGGIIRVSNATIQPTNITRTQYSLASPRTSNNTPAFRDVGYNPGYSDYNFAGPGNGLQIDPNTGTITGTPTRPGTFAYVVKAETYNGSTRLSEVRRELQVIVKECPPNPQPKLNLTEVSKPSVPTSNTFCPGKIAQLNVLGGIPDGKLQWQLNGKTIAGATSSTLLVDQEGTYTVSVEKPTSCPPFALSDPLTVTVIAASVSLTSGLSTGTDCQNAVSLLQANASAGATFRWLRDGILLPGISTQTYSTSIAGNYVVQITQPDGCTAASSPMSVSTATALVAPAILASVSAICPGGSAALSVNPAAGLNYQWFRDGQAIAGATTNVLSATQAGAYTVRIQTPANCTAISAPARISVFTPQSIGIVGEAQICQGSSTSLTLSNPTINTAGWQFSWQRNGTTVGSLPIYNATSAGTYRLRITDARGCTAISSDWLVNEVKAITVQMSPLAPVCLSPATPVSLSGSPSGGVFSGSGVTGNQFNPATAGVGTHKLVYTITGSSSCLSGTATQSVEVRPFPVISLPARLTTLVGTPVTLPGPEGTGFTYSWNPPLGLSDPLIRNPLASPGQTTLYQLQIRDSFGCLAEASVLVELIEPIVRLYVPSAFTPNGDANNNTWKLWGAEGFPNMEVTVFNRWGTVIFHSTGYENPFDGYYKGEKVPAGMYTYIIRYDDKVGPLRGTLMVIY